MLRRAALIVGSFVLVAAMSGCAELSLHADRLGEEFHTLHHDVRDIFFGIDRPEREATWQIYD